MSDANLFATHGESLVENGYDLVLIRQGEKRPALDDWTELKIGTKEVTEWSRRYPRANIGIQTRHTPAVDIDVYDARIAAELEAWVLDHFSDRVPVRVGQAPKRLMLFRTDRPFRKLKHAYVDGSGKKHAVEILGEGQQFVAFGIHPDTKKPFDWTSLENPLDIAADDLTTITQEDAQNILAQFDRIAAREGWKPAKQGNGVAKPTSTAMTVVDDDDALLNLSQTVDDYDEADVRDALSLVEGAEDYDHWLQVGMALHHQFNGDDTGYELWDEWSQQAHNYDADALETKWKSFAALRSGGKATTLRYIIKCAKEGAKQKAKDEFSRLENMIASCNDGAELFDHVAISVRDLDLQAHQIAKITSLVQKRLVEIDGVKMPISEVRKEIGKKAKRPVGDKAKMPAWLDAWVWMESGDCFYNYKTHSELTIRSFNARYDVEMLSPEDKALHRAIPETRASDAALTTYGIPKIRNKIYMPGAEPLLLVNGEPCVNIYDGRSVPEIEVATTREEKKALKAVQNHLQTLFPDQRERELLISFLAYQVQCPSERVNWGVVVQGVEGAGKTWFQNLMARVLGPKNVGPVNAKSLFSDFNGWAEGRKMIFVEEIRLHGHNRYEVLDNIKTNITNDTIEITRKGRDPYSCPNISSYMMFTNYGDAMPLGKGDRRYLILKTVFQNRVQLLNFMRRNPSHFDDIFAAVAEHPGVLRGWLMSWKLSDEFKPDGHAPETFAKNEMRDINMTDEQLAILDAIADSGKRDCSPYLVNTATLKDALEQVDVYLPKTTALKSFLEQGGFVCLGRFRVDGVQSRYWTSRPDLFPHANLADRLARITRILAGEEPEFL